MLMAMLNAKSAEDQVSTFMTCCFYRVSIFCSTEDSICRFSASLYARVLPSILDADAGNSLPECPRVIASHRRLSIPRVPCGTDLALSLQSQ
jgi:hypothetical protein